jgi:hypothetical protein
MREMGWSWADLQSAPFDLVDELIERINAERSYTAKRRKLDEQMKE